MICETGIALEVAGELCTAFDSRGVKGDVMKLEGVEEIERELELEEEMMKLPEKSEMVFSRARTTSDARGGDEEGLR